MERFEIAVAGAGLAARTVEAYRAAGGDAGVVVLGREARQSELEGSFDEGRAIVRYREPGRLVGALATRLTDEEQDGLENEVCAAAA